MTIRSACAARAWLSLGSLAWNWNRNDFCKCNDFFPPGRASMVNILMAGAAAGRWAPPSIANKLTVWRSELRSLAVFK